jgi:alkylmercury lyase
MQAPAIPTVSQYWAALKPHLPRFSPDEQRTAVALYRELAKGQAVRDAQLAGALGISAAECRALLQRDSIKRLTYADGDGLLVGFGGLAAAPMHHRFEVDGRDLSTWCAWDSLFVPEILRRPARILSTDPESGEKVHLIVTPERIEWFELKETVISFIWPDAQVFATSAANVMARSVISFSFSRHGHPPSVGSPKTPGHLYNPSIMLLSWQSGLTLTILKLN